MEYPDQYQTRASSPKPWDNRQNALYNEVQISDSEFVVESLLFLNDGYIHDSMTMRTMVDRFFVLET